MNSVFVILMFVAMALVLASLAFGLLTMAKGGEFARRYGNKAMRWRVFLQGAALLFFVLAVAAGAAN